MFQLKDGITRNRVHGGFALTSVCSAHPQVIAASLELARTKNTPIIIEATSNQVNQFGGYTGMTPSDFITFVAKISEDVGYPVERIIFGGDHLGPQAWREYPAQEAMANAKIMVRDYVAAGFSKIHLDCSEGCLGESASLCDEIVAERAASLAQICENATTDDRKPYYIIGTEVPPPGGARGEENIIQPTKPEAALQTIEIHRQAFMALGLEDAWSRVCGLVVQPGLEFSADHIDHFDRKQPDLLSKILENYPTIAFEAHSTDYQEANVFAELAQRHFTFLKVGPALTFAYREAIYALSHIDHWLTGEPHIAEIMEKLMLKNNRYWLQHYQTTDEIQLKYLRHFSYADRIRYYWTQREAIDAVEHMMQRLKNIYLPQTLLEQYFFPQEITQSNSKNNHNLPQALIRTHIMARLEPYLNLSAPHNC